MKMHYGIGVDPDVPVTGVVSNNTPEFLNDEIDSGIDPEYELLSEKEAEDLQEYSPNYVLIGSWKKDEDGKYTQDEEGEYAAIVDLDQFYTTQVVWSKYTKRVKLCSPCFPGQGDLDSPDPKGCLAYDLPPDVYGESEGDEEE